MALRRFRVATALLVALALSHFLLSSAALGHGGSLRGPGAGVPGRGSGSTGGRSQAGITGVSVERWELWWAFNREEFLWSSGLRTGERAEGAGTQERPLSQRIEKDLFPVIAEALTSRDIDLRDTAAFVLGKTGRPDLALPLLEKAVRDKVQSVVESVALALGSLGHEDGIPLLVELLKNPRSKTRTRAYAGLSLGFIGTDGAYDVLKSGVGFAKRRSSPLDVRNMEVDSARVLGMGLTATDEARRHLIHLIGASARKDKLRSLLPLAIARAGDRDAAQAVLALMDDPNVQVRRSAAIALGRLASPEDEVIVRRLAYAVDKDSDNSVKNFACISLGRIGGDEAIEYLKKNFERIPYLTRAFAAIGLGISGDRGAGKLLHDAFRESREQSFRSACAIALGILGYRDAGKEILATLEKEKNDTFRESLVNALGIMPFPEAIPTIRRIVSRERDPKLRGEAGEALALLGDDGAVDILIGVLQDDGGVYLNSSASIALGRLRTPQSFDALVKVVQSDRYNPTVRSFALAAVGRIIDPNTPPVLARVTIDHNYRIEIGYLFDLLTLI